MLRWRHSDLDFKRSLLSCWNATEERQPLGRETWIRSINCIPVPPSTLGWPTPTHFLPPAVYPPRIALAPAEFSWHRSSATALHPVLFPEPTQMSKPASLYHCYKQTAAHLPRLHLNRKKEKIIRGQAQISHANWLLRLFGPTDTENRYQRQVIRDFRQDAGKHRRIVQKNEGWLNYRLNRGRRDGKASSKLMIFIPWQRAIASLALQLCPMQHESATGMPSWYSSSMRHLLPKRSENHPPKRPARKDSCVQKVTHNWGCLKLVDCDTILIEEFAKQSKRSFLQPAILLNCRHLSC